MSAMRMGLVAFRGTKKGLFRVLAWRSVNLPSFQGARATEGGHICTARQDRGAAIHPPGGHRYREPQLSSLGLVAIGENGLPCPFIASVCCSILYGYVPIRCMPQRSATKSNLYSVLEAQCVSHLACTF